MTNVDFDSFDHESHMEEALDLARESAERGDRPFGSVLVRNNEVVMREGNRVNTEDDIRRHPELHLAHRACREIEPEKRAETVMYTSTEPCPMCAGGMLEAGFAQVIYSVGSEEMPEFTGAKAAVKSAKVLDNTTEVIGPILNERGRKIHEDFDW